MKKHDLRRISFLKIERAHGECGVYTAKRLAKKELSQGLTPKEKAELDWLCEGRVAGRQDWLDMVDIKVCDEKA